MLETLKKQILLAKAEGKNNFAIKVNTIDKWKKVLGLLDSLGYQWASGVKLMDKNYHSDCWTFHGDRSHLIVHLKRSTPNCVRYGSGCTLNDNDMVISYEDLFGEEKTEEEKMSLNANTINLKEWAYTRDDIGMTNLAKYIYQAFAKKFAKAYKERYKTEQSESVIEKTVYMAFRDAHQCGNYYRTPAKLVVMNQSELDISLWKIRLRLETCAVSKGLYFKAKMYSRKIDGEAKYVSRECMEKFNELYFYCEKCDCYHEKAKTNFVKVYNHQTESVENYCSKATSNYKLIDGVYYHPALVKEDGTVAKHRVLSYHGFDWHSPKAQSKSLGNDDNSLKMGIEIETYGNPANSAFVNRYDDHFHCENDGSLSYGNSFEMISVPMTKNYWDSIRNTIIDPLFNTLRTNGQTEGNNGYGLHVHIDSKAFKDLDSVKWFIYNVQLHQRLIQKVARRNSNHYYDYQTGDGVYAVEELSLSRLQQQFSSHGTCVNTHMCGNGVGKTVELRVFKSTLDSETLYATLKLVENLVRLANEHSTNRRELLRGLKDYAIRQRIVIE